MPKILVVDDSETQRFQIKQALESAGHSVVEAQDGADALEKLQLNPDVALIICDVNMPRMDGLTMCARVKETGKFPELPIFMLTTEASPELKQVGKGLGVRAWVTKPFVPQKIIDAVEKVTKKQ